MKKFLDKKIVFSFLIGGFLFGSIGVGATLVYNSNEINYTPSDSTWEVNNVENALNELYEKTSNTDIVSIWKYMHSASVTNLILPITENNDILTTKNGNEIIMKFNGKINLNILYSSAIGKEHFEIVKNDEIVFTHNKTGYDLNTNLDIDVNINDKLFLRVSGGNPGMYNMLIFVIARKIN